MLINNIIIDWICKFTITTYSKLTEITLIIIIIIIIISIIITWSNIASSSSKTYL